MLWSRRFNKLCHTQSNICTERKVRLKKAVHWAAVTNLKDPGEAFCHVLTVSASRESVALCASS
jgi:hypothetical protein